MGKTPSVRNHPVMARLLFLWNRLGNNVENLFEEENFIRSSVFYGEWPYKGVPETRINRIVEIINKECDLTLNYDDLAGKSFDNFLEKIKFTCNAKDYQSLKNDYLKFVKKLNKKYSKKFEAEDLSNSVSFEDNYEKLEPDTIDETKFRQDRALLLTYYENKLNELQIFSFKPNKEQEEQKVALITKPDWVDLSINLENKEQVKNEVTTQFIAAPKLSGTTKKILEETRERAEKENNKVFNRPIFVPQALQLEEGYILKYTMGVSGYKDYIFNVGLVVNELGYTLSKYNGNIHQASAHLPLRDAFLPDDTSFLNLNRLQCPSVVTTLAIADGDNNFLTFVAKRKNNVPHNKGKLSPIPTGVMQPIVPPKEGNRYNPDESSIAFTTQREFFEEIFNGEEALKDYINSHSNFSPDFFISDPDETDDPQSKKVRCKSLYWLTEGWNKKTEVTKKPYSIELTGIGYDLASGCLEFAVLFTINNPLFHKTFKADYSFNWEIYEKYNCFFYTQHNTIPELINQPDKWTASGFFSFILGMKRLQERFPSHFHKDFGSIGIGNS